jgi:Arc-like DNA binding domain
MSVDLFLKKVPLVIKDLIGREANSNRRSINQEAIALLEEALLLRVELGAGRRPSAHQRLESYAAGRAEPLAREAAADSGPMALDPPNATTFAPPRVAPAAKH